MQFQLVFYLGYRVLMQAESVSLTQTWLNKAFSPFWRQPCPACRHTRRRHTFNKSDFESCSPPTRPYLVPFELFYSEYCSSPCNNRIIKAKWSCSLPRSGSFFFRISLRTLARSSISTGYKFHHLQ
jgi:hypothetical protein